MSEERSAGHLRVAAVGLLLFATVMATAGRIRESGGLGYDGVVYARMVTDGLDAGFPNARLRPLVLVVNRGMHRLLGTDVVTTFVLTNTVFMFGLGLGLSLLTAQYGAPEYVRAVFVGNVAVTISTAQMAAYYPVLVDLGALALLVLAVYAAIAAPAWAAAAAAVAAVTSREFGMAAVLFGVHRELRLRRPVRAALIYSPAVAAFAALRWYVAGTQPPDGGPEGAMLTATELAGNAALWLSAPFVFFFGYFLVTVFGGLTALLFVRLRDVWGLVRREHELLSLTVPVLALAAIGSADIWRYLLYLLPGVAILFVAALRLPSNRTMWTLAAVTLVTIATQRPWREVTEDRYFAEWFPYYAWLSGEPLPEGTLTMWGTRAALVCSGLLLLRAAANADRPAPEPAQTYYVRQ